MFVWQPIILMERTMIKNIIFDVGMVLVDFCWEKVMHKLGFSGELFERMADATVRSKAWRDYDRSLLSDEEVLAALIANAPELEEEIRLFWDHTADTIACYPYAEKWIRSFKEKGYRCYILSNYSERTYRLTRAELPFLALMDGAIFSWQVKQIKPEQEIYRTLLERYQLEPEECVFLDDSRENVEAAGSVGMHAILFTGKERAETELAKLSV